jgi:hypothetical protein
MLLAVRQMHEPDRARWSGNVKRILMPTARQTAHQFHSAYLIMGSILWSAMASLGEMTALFPVKGPIIDFPSRYLDEGVGFATGWMAW